jgi:NAD(P)H-nitrite reductase large subunit
VSDSNRQICLCFHVTQRKILNFIRIEKPKRVGQLSDCFGAGTGCGWCRPFLEKMFEQAVSDGHTQLELPTDEEYARMRGKYVRDGGGTPPPGATPVGDE